MITIRTTIFSSLWIMIVGLWMSSCHRDDHDHGHDHNEINLLQITLKDAVGDSIMVKADFSKTPSTIDTLKIRRGKIYNTRIRLFDNTGNKMEDITAGIISEANNHILLFCAENGTISVTKTDVDANGRAIGLAANLVASNAGFERLRIKILHDAKKNQVGAHSDCEIMNNINQAGNKVGGETDFDATIPVMVGD